MTNNDFLKKLYFYKNELNMSFTTFGRKVCGDANLIKRAENGREFKESTMKRYLNRCNKLMKDIKNAKNSGC